MAAMAQQSRSNSATENTEQEGANNGRRESGVGNGQNNNDQSRNTDNTATDMSEALQEEIARMSVQD